MQPSTRLCYASSVRFLVSLTGAGLGLFLATLAAAQPSQDNETLVTLRLPHEAVIERGRATPLSIGLTLAPGVHLLDDGPLTLELEGSAVQPASRALHRRDAVDPRAEAPRFEIDLRAERTGAPSLRVRLLAWACRGSRCRPIELTAPIPLSVKGP